MEVIAAILWPEKHAGGLPSGCVSRHQYTGSCRKARTRECLDAWRSTLKAPIYGFRWAHFVVPCHILTCRCLPRSNKLLIQTNTLFQLYSSAQIRLIRSIPSGVEAQQAEHHTRWYLQRLLRLYSTHVPTIRKQVGMSFPLVHMSDYAKQ